VLFALFGVVLDALAASEGVCRGLDDGGGDGVGVFSSRFAGVD